MEGEAFVAFNADAGLGNIYDPLGRGHPVDSVTQRALDGGKPQLIVYGEPLIGEIEVWDDAAQKWIHDVWDEATQTWLRVSP
jgi:hypothetical protein